MKLFKKKWSLRAIMSLHGHVVLNTECARCYTKRGAQNLARSVELSPEVALKTIECALRGVPLDVVIEVRPVES